MRGWLDATVDVDGARLGFSRRGHDAFGVIVLHGQLGDRRVVQPLIEAVEGRTVVAPDLRGRGSTLCRDVGFHTWHRYTEDVVSLLDALELEAVVLAGVSLGAGVAIATALAHPHRVDGLVLWASPYRGARNGWSEEQRLVQGPVVETARRVLEEGDEVLRQPDGEIAPRWRRHDPQSVAAALIGLGWSQPFSDLEELAAIAAPVIVIPGADVLHAPEIAHHYLDALPRASLGRSSPAVIADFTATI